MNIWLNALVYVVCVSIVGFAMHWFSILDVTLNEAVKVPMTATIHVFGFLIISRLTGVLR